MIDFLKDYVVLVVLGLCYCIGFLLKHVVASEKIDRFIPLICGLCGVFFNFWASAWSISPEIILGGLASGLASTGVNQIYKQFSKGEDE